MIILKEYKSNHNIYNLDNMYENNIDYDSMVNESIEFMNECCGYTLQYNNADFLSEGSSSIFNTIGQVISKIAEYISMLCKKIVEHIKVMFTSNKDLLYKYKDKMLDMTNAELEDIDMIEFHDWNFDINVPAVEDIYSEVMNLDNKILNNTITDTDVDYYKNLSGARLDQMKMSALKLDTPLSSNISFGEFLHLYFRNNVKDSKEIEVTTPIVKDIISKLIDSDTNMDKIKSDNSRLQIYYAELKKYKMTQPVLIYNKDTDNYSYNGKIYTNKDIINMNKATQYLVNFIKNVAIMYQTIYAEKISAYKEMTNENMKSFKQIVPYVIKKWKVI
jgi:hypothetical protein